MFLQRVGLTKGLTKTKEMQRTASIPTERAPQQGDQPGGEKWAAALEQRDLPARIPPAPMLHFPPHWPGPPALLLFIWRSGLGQLSVTCEKWAALLCCALCCFWGQNWLRNKGQGECRVSKTQAKLETQFCRAISCLLQFQGHVILFSLNRWRFRGSSKPY